MIDKPDPIWPPDHDRIVCEVLDSTNCEATRIAGAIGRPTWILARHQRAGRGRRGREWLAEGGSFTASLVWRPPQDLPLWGQHSFVAALALHDVIADLAPSADTRLKWPNDVLVANRKISGILLETEKEHLIVGIGVNLLTAPRSQPGSIALSEVANEVPRPEAFLGLLAAALNHRQAQLENDGFAEVRADWLARAAGLGTEIEAKLPHATHTGIFEDIDATGALILKTDEERLVLAAGDVYFSSTGRS